MNTASALRQWCSEGVYKVTTEINGVIKTQRWDTSKPLTLPAPLHIEIRHDNGKLLWKKNGSPQFDLLGPLNPYVKCKLDQPPCRIIFEEVRWAYVFKEETELQSTQLSLYYLAVTGFGPFREDVVGFKESVDLCVEDQVAARASSGGEGLQFEIMAPGLFATIRSDQPEPCLPGMQFTVKNANLRKFRIFSNANWWKFSPVFESFEILGFPELKRSRFTSIISGILSLFFLISVGNFGYRAWKGWGEDYLQKANEQTPVDVAPVVMDTLPKNIKLPEQFVHEQQERQKERKIQIEEKAKAVALQGDGKVAKLTEPIPQAPVAPAPKLVKQPIAKKVIPVKTQAAVALPRFNPVVEQPRAQVGGQPSQVVSLESDQTKKVLAKQAESLKSAFGSVVGMLNQASPAQPNVQALANAAKRGGLVTTGVSAGVAGTGAPSNTQMNVLGQVGAEAGVGVATGVAGGTGLSARYQGSPNGTGIGGAKHGSLFVDYDGVNSSGKFSGMITEGLTKDEVGAVIHAHADEIQECYENALLQRTSLAGRWVVDFSIQADGTVHEAKIAEQSTDSKALASCLVQKMKIFRYPNPRNGVTVQVTYPFSFRTIGGSQ